MYKALITDIDGTAVPISSDGHNVAEATRMAVQRAQAAGCKLACATGREWEIAEPVVKALGFTAPCIVEGGTRIVDVQTGATVWEKYLDAGVAKAVLQTVQGLTDEGLLMTSADITRRPITTVTSVPDRLRFMFLVGVPNEVAVRLIDAINGKMQAIAHMTPSWEGGELVDVHITHPEGTKAHAVQVWQKREGVTKAQTIGMGDSGNDMPIFESSGLKVAVDNATAELKMHADYVAPDVGDDPLKHVIERFLLEQPAA